MQETHIFTGINRAKHPTGQDPQHLWDAHNIRITTRDDSTMLSITNEKSTKFITSFSPEEKYVGHVSCGKYLVVFIHTGSKDIIYRITLDTITKEILYEGNLNFDIENPIQAIYNYETDLIQKVYWVDGINQPRVINISKPELTNQKYDNELGYTECYKDSPFNFVQELKLNEDIKVTRNDNDNGIFSPGVIQYAFTYYFKYGQESNIFYVTEPHYVAHASRGATADSRVNCSFTINIGNIDTKFEYVRIYSIMRTSLNSVPTVKRVKDISIKDNTSYTYIDTNTEGDTVDPTQLLYLGGKDIIANCIHSKDLTLFLGNIKYNRVTPYEVIDKRNDIKLSDIVSNISISTNKREIELKSDIGTFYNYKNQLFTNTLTFKSRDHYRLGVQLQYKNGEWSEPIPIKNNDNGYEHTMNLWPTFSVGNTTALYLPIFVGTLNYTPEQISTIKNAGYIKIRPIIVPPTSRDRKILAQGILCPTVFNALNRFNNSPYAQSSWLIRPITSTTQDSDILSGVYPAYAHLKALYGQGRPCEVQNMITTNRTEGSIDNWSTVLEEMNEFDFSNSGAYYVDQSILTFHSPDVEFDTDFHFLEGDQINMRLAGAVDWKSNYGDIDIQTSSETINAKAGGFMHVTASSDNNGGKSLISGLFYEDSIVKYEGDDKGFAKVDKIKSVPWMVYMWHNSGSLNNDINRNGMGTRTSQLRKKKIANIKYSEQTSFLENPKNLSTSSIELFNSNEVSQIKLNIKESKDSKVKTISYFGNVDTLTGGKQENYLEIGSTVSSSIITDPENIKSGKVTLNVNTSGYADLNGTLKGGGNYSNAYLTLSSVTVEKTDSTNKYKVSGNVSEYTGAIIDVNGTQLSTQIKKINFIGTYISEEGNNEDSTTINLQLDKESVELVFTVLDQTNTFKNIGGSAKITVTYDAEKVEFNDKFNSILSRLSSKETSDKKYPELVHPAFPVRIKYKSTPHLVFALTDTDGVSKNLLDYNDGSHMHFSWLAELYQEPINPYGDISDNIWIPAGEAVRIDGTNDLKVIWKYGDTWYQRYDCLKTYPFTNEDENQVIEIASFMCETRVNLDGRTDRNRGLISNLNVSPQNFNLRNDIYNQSDNFFNYRKLEDDFYKINNYPSQVLWGNTKGQGDTIDSWTNLHLANSINLDGNYGSVTSINSFRDTLIGFQEYAINNILFNSRVQVETTDGVPIEIANNNKVEGTRYISTTVGCSDKFSIIDGNGGLYFVDSKTQGLYCIGESLENIGLLSGMNQWLTDVGCDIPWRYNNLYNNKHNGIRLFFDPINSDIYFIPGKDKDSKMERDALCYSEQLQSFVSTYSYGGSVMFFNNSKVYSLADSSSGVLTLWEHFSKDTNDYCNIFGIPRAYKISFISNDNPIVTKIFDNIEFKGDLVDSNNNIENEDYKQRSSNFQYNNPPFDLISVSNEYQKTGVIPFNKASLRRKFRYWRGNIPRQESSRARIRSPWCNITLIKNPTNKKATIYGVAVNYTI